MTKAFIKLLLVVTTILSINVNSKEKRTIENCIPNEKIILERISINADYKDITQELGLPKAKEEYKGEDDGGVYTGSILKFDSMEIYYNDLRGIEKITTKNKNVNLSPGIKIGMSIEEVGKILYFYPLGSPKLITIPGCNQDTMSILEVSLYFASEKENSLTSYLTQIDIFHYGP